MRDDDDDDDDDEREREKRRKNLEFGEKFVDFFTCNFVFFRRLPFIYM